ncbi:MAG: glycosyltransferase family 4 protein [Deltaproteobacteria bacterium]|nr:glycosyltransferase family 4 protein [Deltaproteobacteria bacterium]
MTLPKTAYILLWFPKPSETFIFREIVDLWKMGVPLKVYTLYGSLNRGLSHEMKCFSNRAEKLGLSSLPKMLRGIIHCFRKDPSLARRVLRTSFIRPWRGIEKTGESFWAIFCAFHLARCFQEEDIRHIHAPWAGGPGTAAWTASRLTGIPFSFSARAWDINPPDGALAAKSRNAAFIRCESPHNRRYMAGFLGGDERKIHVIHNPMTLRDTARAPVKMNPPHKLLAVGRLVEKKGFNHLIRSCEILSASGLDFQLKIAGEGPEKGRLKRLVKTLHMRPRVKFLGHVPHDRIPELMHRADILIMPSQRAASGDIDGLPTVISEALLHTLPVIATDVAGIRNLIVDGKTGLLVPQRDPSAIAKAVKRIVDDRTWALDMAERGRLKVMDMYDSAKNNRALLNLIQNHAAKTVGEKPFGCAL